jgi:hypothetical protein
MFTISQKAKENISLTVSLACLLISALWIVFHATLTGNTNLSDTTGFHWIMILLSLPFGGIFYGTYIAPAVAVLAGFFSAANYFRSDRPAIRTVSRVTLIAQAAMTVALGVFITIAVTC